MRRVKGDTKLPEVDSTFLMGGGGGGACSKIKRAPYHYEKKLGKFVKNPAKNP